MFSLSGFAGSSRWVLSTWIVANSRGSRRGSEGASSLANGDVKWFVRRKVLCALRCPTTLAVEVAFDAALGSRSDKRQKQAAMFLYRIFEMVLEMIACGETITVEPDEAALALQFFCDTKR
jgi:hypothetical protein